MEKSKLEQAAVKEVEAYQFFNPRLRENDYAFGDIYSKKDIAEAQEQWAIPRYVACKDTYSALEIQFYVSIKGV